MGPFRANGNQALAEWDHTICVIARCKDNMKVLWGDDVIYQVLAQWKVKLVDSAELSVPISRVCDFVLSLFLIKKQLLRPTRPHCKLIVQTFK
jgi:hypothetical protein